MDVNDVATVNRINEDNAHLHKENVIKLIKYNPHDLTKKVSVNTNDGDKVIIVDCLQYKNSHS